MSFTDGDWRDYKMKEKEVKDKEYPICPDCLAYPCSCDDNI